MKKIKIIFIIIYCLFSIESSANDENFNTWLKNFKLYAQKEGISVKTVNSVMDKAIFLPKVIEYDRYQPEFYEDTFTYINKRTNEQKVIKGKEIYLSNKKLINKVENKFDVEKELLLALMGIETNYGTYLGKMDIISSLATLSFDKRRSKFFTNELVTLLKLIDLQLVNKNKLFGSWAGAFGNFQFMPTTIKNYAIDYDSDNKIDLKSPDDSFASAANYINRIGWKKNEPCFFEVKLKDNTPDYLLNTSAKKLKNIKKVSFFEKYVINYNKLNIDDSLKAALITPDKEIVENANKLYPAYLVFKNYELVLKWNRSLRFALAVCTLKNKFKNEL